MAPSARLVGAPHNGVGQANQADDCRSTSDHERWPRVRGVGRRALEAYDGALRDPRETHGPRERENADSTDETGGVPEESRGKCRNDGYQCRGCQDREGPPARRDPQHSCDRIACGRHKGKES